MSARSAALEMIERAEEQGYRVSDRGGGSWMVYAPPGRSTVPGYEFVMIHLPRTDGGNALQTIRANLRRAGVKFPEDIARERVRTIQTQASKMTQPSTSKNLAHTAKPAGATESDPLETLLAICNKQADLAAQAAGLIEQVRKSMKDKVARAEQIVAAQELLQKAAQGQW